MRFVVLIPDGVGIRNFLCTEFIALLRGSGEVCVSHGLSEQAVAPFVREHGATVRWEKLPRYREDPVSRVLRQAKIKAQLRRKSEAGWQSMVGPRSAKAPLRARVLSALAEALAGRCASADAVVMLHRVHEAVARRSAAARQAAVRLRAFRPDVVFCTHQRASLAVPVMAAARGQGIPTATFIYSWDNPPKGRMAVHADHYLVWSDWMREEMANYYPDVPPARVHVVGTPQFEHYFNPKLLRPREEFLRALGLDPQRRVVCFSGDDITTSPHDPLYLADTAQAIRQLGTEERPQLVLRRCPTDLSGRFGPVLHEYPEICISEPLWRAGVTGDWTQVVPTQEDVALLANLVCHTDVMINLGSTMAMDAAIFGKPSIFLAYAPEGQSDQNVRSIYRLPHFEWVHKLQPVYWARSAAELSSLVARALGQPAEKEAARRAWVEKTVAQPMDGASRRCAEVLKRIAAARG